MARMYPPYLPSGVKSPGEPEVFRRLRDDPLTANWLAFYSVDITNHVRQVVGEIDVVVVVPEMGVLCLEGKAVQSIRRQDGVWHLGYSSAPDTRGPFKQAAEGIQSLRNYSAERELDLARVVY